MNHEIICIIEKLEGKLPSGENRIPEIVILVVLLLILFWGFCWDFKNLHCGIFGVGFLLFWGIFNPTHLATTTLQVNEN